MKAGRFLLTLFILLLFTSAENPRTDFDFRIRTITAGITLDNLSDSKSIEEAVDFLNSARKTYEDNGYVVQTVRISTQHIHELVSGELTEATIGQLQKIDEILVRSNVGMAMGQLVDGDQYDPDLAKWTAQLVKKTSNINFSIAISSEKHGIHQRSIKTAAEICEALSHSPGGEANFRFTASANCPSNIPFFPAAFHTGVNSFAIGLEYPNVISKVFNASSWENAESNLTKALNDLMNPIEQLALTIQNDKWKYDGIDTSPAPGLDASIGDAIEALTKKPFGSATTLATCAIITKVIKNLAVKSCGYSGLMLPVIEDKTLSKRAMEGQYTIEELLLFSSVSGTGLDVVPIAGTTSREAMEGIYRDVAALSIRYFNKALSARLFPIPGKNVGDKVEFENPYLTTSQIMEIH